jgi:hypothetical protein
VNSTLELIQSLGLILRTQMALKEDQTVLYNQPFKIPPDKRLYASIGVIGGRTFAAKSGYYNDPVSGELKEGQGVNRQEIVSVMLYSKSTEALERNWEVVAAFNSTVAQQEQEKGSFKIGNLPLAMNDVSEGEGARRLYRYSLTVAVLVAYRRDGVVQYFENFQQPEIVSNP